MSKPILFTIKVDATITYDEVPALIGINIPLLKLRPNFERI
jgi:hypothetical protein